MRLIAVLVVNGGTRPGQARNDLQISLGQGPLTRVRGEVGHHRIEHARLYHALSVGGDLTDTLGRERGFNMGLMYV